MADIDVFTFLTTYSYDFADFLRKTGEATKSGNNRIHWKCVISKGARKVPHGFKCVANIKYNYPSDSLNHGLLINDALAKIKSDYVVITDADIAITCKDWDDEIVKILDGGFSCFGSPNIQKEREGINFPNVPFFTFKKEIMKKVELDFTPRIYQNDYENRGFVKIKSINEEEAEHYY